jgi:hypothetical protein
MLAVHVAVAFAIDVVHAWLHIPQLFRSLVVSAHVDPHSIAPASHPETHAYTFPEPAQSGVPEPHTTPHAPQLLAVSIGVSQP